MKWLIVCNPNHSGRRVWIGPYDKQTTAYNDRDTLLEKTNITLEETGIICTINFEDALEWLYYQVRTD